MHLAAAAPEAICRYYERGLLRAECDYEASLPPHLKQIADPMDDEGYVQVCRRGHDHHDIDQQQLLTVMTDAAARVRRCSSKNVAELEITLNRLALSGRPRPRDRYPVKRSIFTEPPLGGRIAQPDDAVPRR